MAVQADEEQEFMDEQEETMDSSDSDEGTALQARQSEEQSGHSTPEDECSEGEITKGNGQREMDDDRVDLKNGGPAQSRQSKVMEDRASKIKAIDDEMLKKITELHGLMTGEGLEESALMLERCVTVMKQKQSGGHLKDKQKSPRPEGFEGMNLNSNATYLSGRQGNNLKRKGGIIKETCQHSKLSKPNIAFDKDETRSVDTIYEPAVEKRGSSSSEKELRLNSSDEQLGDTLNKSLDQILSEFQSSGARGTAQGEDYPTRSEVFPRGHALPTLQGMTSQGRGGEEGYVREELMPSTSQGGGATATRCDSTYHFTTPEEKVQDMIRQAELSKARMFNTPGKHFEKLLDRGVDLGQVLSPTAVVDEGYFMVGAHLDESVVNKIGQGEYVDFGKLLPKDKVASVDEDCRFEMVIKNGKTFWTPMANSVSINSFAKWEQAFRVFSNVYCKANPNRAAELIEYNNVIHTIAMAYTWENVYTYDKEFCMHMARYPQRSWAMILQQPWSLKLRDRTTGGNNWGNVSSNANSLGRAKINEPCRRFNRGKCNFGTNCKYDHKCSYCFKFRYGAVYCRRALGDWSQRQQRDGDKDKKESASSDKHENRQFARR